MDIMSKLMEVTLDKPMFATLCGAMKSGHNMGVISEPGHPRRRQGTAAPRL